eukprot:m51a1_g12129 hypothetical protein (79) ;mRNA; f:292-634
MQAISKKLAMAAKMNIAIKAISIRALFSEEITEGDFIFDNINNFRFVMHQKLMKVDISKANGKTIVPVIHKHIKKVVL